MKTKLKISITTKMLTIVAMSGTENLPWPMDYIYYENDSESAIHVTI